MVPRRALLIPLVVASLMLSLSCAYIVLPEGLDNTSIGAGAGDGVWTAIVTGLGTSDDGNLRVDITIRNDTGAWSTMRAADGKPASLTGSDGKTTLCETVLIGTGGHRLAPGFQMRGYMHDENGEPEPQLLYVECAGAGDAAGSTLSIDYLCLNGELDYYVEVEETNKVEGKLVLNLDEVVADASYPVASPVDGLIMEPGTEITGLSDNVVTLLNVERNGAGFSFTWQNYNPSKFALKTHIGTPPVIGSDGIIYGVYETLDMPEVPLTPAQGTAEWTTEVGVPEDVGDLYILLSVESKKPRTYLHYAIAIPSE